MSIIHTLKTITLVSLIASTSFAAGERAKRSHVTFGVGIVVDEFPVAVADLVLPISSFAYDFSFMDVEKPIRTSIELGVYGFYGILPVPEVGANLYVGSESRDIQGKLGLSGFYDISIGGHAGLAIEPAIIIKNRFEIGFLIVPLGTDSRVSYTDYFGFGSSESDTGSTNSSQNVPMPYFGLMLGARF